ncbi:MAG: hbdA [Hydrocarboniphaga sp.]|uniref:3-hydroxybutyryl-CoA dehydrogenase n=1 Tax=Hydrocarboniphaga sp. TaxID=2033016 RepID=UPI00260CD868|nr:3-hydroxybutyryl-CoA dehydrogenase [Hydrocarboniphaga sp.]MDB5968529.1 hbdA [Hydrocarboniphaga sp.]
MSIRKIGVIGAGTMGNGIAQVCAASALAVTLVDINDAALDRGFATISSSLDKLIKKDKLSAAERDAILGRIARTTDYAQLTGADLVIEAATENLDLKRKILKQIDGLLHPGAILATNTSSLSITELAACTTRADRFIGLHFFNPVPLMSLVEVITGIATSDDTRERVLALARAVGKAPITVRNNAGFAVNRILCPMINEAIFALQEGVASAEDIDTGMKLGCNHPIGPLALADMIGLDTLLAIMEVLHKDFGDPKYRPASRLREMVAAGRLGRKSGQGFYPYN